MAYEGRALALLEAAGAAPGDSVSLSLADGREYRGVLMPRHDFTSPDVIVVKLESGYNVGVRVGPADRLALVERAARGAAKAPEAEPRPGLPKVAFLGTGGTIASYVDYRTGAVHPAVTADQVLSSAPELTGVCQVEAKVLYGEMSEDIRAEHWQRIAREACGAFASGASGVVVSHGTDTMGYTAAALSFMLRDLPGPVVLVGSQRSSDRPSSDAGLNLMCAAHLAARADLGEVVVVMHEGPSDDFCAVHRGTRVRKMHSSRRGAFESAGGGPLGRIDGSGRPDLEGFRARAKGGPTLLDGMAPAALIYFYPGMTPEMFESQVRGVGGAVVAGTGMGHVSSELVPVVKRAVSAGKVVVMTSQCFDGTVNLNVYSTGRELLKAGVVQGGDMLPETAYVKLMWALGQSGSAREVARAMAVNVAGEMEERRGA